MQLKVGGLITLTICQPHCEENFSLHISLAFDIMLNFNNKLFLHISAKTDQNRSPNPTLIQEQHFKKLSYLYIVLQDCKKQELFSEISSTAYRQLKIGIISNQQVGQRVYCLAKKYANSKHSGKLFKNNKLGV